MCNQKETHITWIVCGIEVKANCPSCTSCVVRTFQARLRTYNPRKIHLPTSSQLGTGYKCCRPNNPRNSKDNWQLSLDWQLSQLAVQGVQVPYYRQNTWHASSKSILIIAFVTIEEALRALTFRWVKSILVRADRAGIWIATLVTIWRTVGLSCHMGGFRFWTNWL